MRLGFLQNVGRAYLHAEPSQRCMTLLSADAARFSPVLLRMPHLDSSRFGDLARSGSMLLRMPQSGSKWLKMSPLALWRSGSIRLNVAQNASKWLTFHTRGRPALWPDPDSTALLMSHVAFSNSEHPTGRPATTFRVMLSEVEASLLGRGSERFLWRLGMTHSRGRGSSFCTLRCQNGRKATRSCEEICRPPRLGEPCSPASERKAGILLRASWAADSSIPHSTRLVKRFSIFFFGATWLYGINTYDVIAAVPPRNIAHPALVIFSAHRARSRSHSPARLPSWHALPRPVLPNDPETVFSISPAGRADLQAESFLKPTLKERMMQGVR